MHGSGSFEVPTHTPQAGAAQPLPRRVLITGGAGFIGSHLAERLLGLAAEVTVYDNLSTGHLEFLQPLLEHPRLRFIRADLLDTATLCRAVEGQDMVFHLAANADVRFGPLHPRRDLEQNTIATQNVLEAMRLGGVHRIGFASTGSVYGEASVFPTPEDCPFPIQTSLYGASKLAAEALISAYNAAWGITGIIFRFVSILGERYTHGHVFDFYKKLLSNPNEIEVLGNGRQRKSYLYVHDCIDAMLTATQASNAPLSIYNLGTNEFCTVDESLTWICEELGIVPVRHYAGGERGWIGDSPFIFLDCARVRALGWRPALSIRDAVLRTLRYLVSNPWLLERR